AAHAMRSGQGRDDGLAPKDVRRQIECGLKHGAAGGSGWTGPLPADPQPNAPPSPEALRKAVEALWAARDQPADDTRPALAPSASAPARIPAPCPSTEAGLGKGQPPAKGNPGDEITIPIRGGGE